MNAVYRHTPMHNWHQEHGATMADVSGWYLPVSYGDPDSEVAACISCVGICDLTPISKLDVRGQGTEKFLAAFTGGRAPVIGSCVALKLAPTVSYAARLAADQCMLLAGSEHRKALLTYLSDTAALHTCVHVFDMTSAYAAVQLVGPLAPELLKRMTPAPIDEMEECTCAQTSLARVWSLIVRLTDRRAPEWLVLVARDYGEYVWQTCINVGRHFHIQPFGTSAERELNRTRASDVAVV